MQLSNVHLESISVMRQLGIHRARCWMVQSNITFVSITNCFGNNSQLNATHLFPTANV